MPPAFSKEEIEAEEKRPKRKVAVLIGYAGTGYKGMQLDYTQKTIEGDLFAAFVAAGAISKANADDPKKSSFVRCARTDKGVHAAGNVISLKLIIEDPDIAEKINSYLSPQIRVWGILRTIGSFSCYQACDSRWYEYLIPTHSFLPPHPSSYLGEKVVELAKEAGDLDGYFERQREVSNFWTDVEEKHIKPILSPLDAESRTLIEKALYGESTSMDQIEDPEEDELDGATLVDEAQGYKTAVNGSAEGEPAFNNAVNEEEQAVTESSDPPLPSEQTTATDEQEPIASNRTSNATLDATIKALRQAYIAAKRSYRISPERLSRIRNVFSRYSGTHNFHNYTIRRQPRDPSAKRHIKSFTVSSDPVVIGDTEWLSLKVHGQSFMMHQIRKMVGMAALIVRCGCDPARIGESLKEDVIAIPKAPGLGLLLERPVFDSYNEKAMEKFEREAIDFDKYKERVEEFKKREIYERIYREEEKGDVFHNFFTHVDAFRESAFLYVTSKGVPACGKREVTGAKPELSRSQRKKSAKKRRREGGKTVARDDEGEDGNIASKDDETVVREDDGTEKVSDQSAAAADDGENKRK